MQDENAKTQAKQINGNVRPKHVLAERKLIY